MPYVAHFGAGFTLTGVGAKVIGIVYCNSGSQIILYQDRPWAGAGRVSCETGRNGQCASLRT